MAKATTTIKQSVQYKPQHVAWLLATQALFNRVAAFYFEVIQVHEKVLELGSQEALTALEKLTHETSRNPHPVLPLSEIGVDIPAMFRRAAIHAALGSAHSFYTHLKKWRARKEKAEAKGKKWTSRPPVPPRTWHKSATLYAGMWKERTNSSMVIKVWTGTCWSWLKIRLTGREIPLNGEMGSPQLIKRGKRWWLHTPIEKHFRSPGKIEKQVTTNAQTNICAVDLNLNEHIAVATIQTVEGTILATRFIGGGKEIADFRKKQLGRIARNRAMTGIIAEGEHDNAALWCKLQNRDEQLAHAVSARIVQFAKAHEATILVFEHLSNLKPTKGKYSTRGNEKRAYWMKGRIFNYARYKAWNEGIVTSRVNPRDTSRECARCGSLVARYAQGNPAEGYTEGAPLVFCPVCDMRGNADRNASLRIGQRLLARYQQSVQEKPLAPLAIEREEQSSGVGHSQDAESKDLPSTDHARHGEVNGHGTALEQKSMDGCAVPRFSSSTTV
jgi:IS605 OrfB family transposase